MGEFPSGFAVGVVFSILVAVVAIMLERGITAEKDHRGGEDKR